MSISSMKTMPEFSARSTASGGQRLLVEQLVALLGDQRRPGGGDGGLVGLGAAAERLAHDVGEIEHAHRGARLAGNVEALQGRGGVGQGELDLLVVQLAGAQLLAEDSRGSPVPRPGRPGRPGCRSSAAWSALALTPARRRSRTMAMAALHQVAHDLVDVAADIADLGELGRLDLQERAPGPAAPGGGRSRSCRRRWGRSSGCSWASPRRAGLGATRWRRQRLRRATATARLASAWPTTKRSSSETISRGENSLMRRPARFPR